MPKAAQQVDMVDRRRAARDAAAGAAELMVIAGDHFGEMTTLRLTDHGEGGVGGWSHRPLPEGNAVAIGFAQPGVPARRGVVARCVPLHGGWQLGIRYEGRLAA